MFEQSSKRSTERIINISNIYNIKQNSFNDNYTYIKSMNNSTSSQKLITQHSTCSSYLKSNNTFSNEENMITDIKQIRREANKSLLKNLCASNFGVNTYQNASNLKKLVYKKKVVNNYISNKYLLQIFKYITSWKSEYFKDSKIDNDIIFLYAEQLHFLFKNYLLTGNNNLKNKIDFINTQKIIDGILCVFDAERTYQISKKNLDDYTLAKIAFNNKNKYYSDLKNFMKKELIKKKGHIKYILQLILEFEIEYINNSKDNNSIMFNYFEEFSYFENMISDIVKMTKKAENFYNLYLQQKDILNNINDNQLVEKIVLDMRKEAQINGDINNKNKIDYLIKILCLDKSLNFIKSFYLNKKNEGINEDNNDSKMIIDQDEEEEFIHT